MKICILVDDYMPDSIKVGAKMMHELAVELKNNGYEVCVVTPKTNLNKRLQIDVLDGIKVYRFKLGEIKNVSKIKRAINETLLSYRAWKSCKNILKKEKQDLIIYYSPSIFWGSLVKKLKNLWGAKSYLILRDFFPQWAIDQELIKKGSIIEYYFRFFEKINYNNADMIGVMSEKNLDIFKRVFNNKYNVEVLYNWTTTSQSVQKYIDYKKKLGLENKIVYFYGGNIGYAQDMMNLIRLAKKMQKYPEAHFVFVGDGDEVDIVKKAISKDKINNLTLLPAVSQEKFKQMLASFDIGLFSLHKEHTTHNFPGKLLGYMVQGLPILGSVNPENDLKDIIESYEAGLITINGEDELFYENALKLISKEYRVHMASNAYELVKSNFSVNTTVEQILRLKE